MAGKFFHPAPDTFCAVEFGGNAVSHEGAAGCVFCRNVMIYFDNAIRSKVLGEVVRLLRPGGYLIVGHAESLAEIWRRN